MANHQDWEVSAVKEVTYGTAVTTEDFLEWGDFKPFTPEVGIVQGVGMRSAVRAPISGRRVSGLGKQAAGPITVELANKGQGWLYEAALGTGTSTLVSGSTYQEVFTLADTLPSYTVQFNTRQIDGTSAPVTFLGSVVDSWELSVENNGIGSLVTTWDSRTWSTAIAAASTSYASGVNLFSFKDLSVSTGTLTLATTTALASSVTALDGVRSVKISCANNLVKDRFYAGASGLKGKPIPGTRLITGELQVDFLANTLRDAFLAQTAMTLLVTLTGSGALSTGFETIQVALSAIMLDGDMPEGSKDGAPSQPIKFTALADLTAAQVVQVVRRTAETAI